MTVKISVLGIEEARQYLKDKKDEINKNKNIGITKATLFVHGEVKESIAGRRAEPTSVDTGRFLNSVDFQTSEDDGIVFTDIPYAEFLEYGTSRITPRPHFRNTAFRSEDKVKEIIKDEI